jgi:flagellar basal body-associated protein FliL
MIQGIALQFPVGPEIFIILLVLLLFMIPFGIALVIVVFWRRKSTKQSEQTQRIDELEQRVEELERE